MVEKRVRNLNKVINAYRKKLEEKIRVTQILLFGSYARGRPRDYSDIDLAVVSPDFEGGTMRDCLLLDRAARTVTPLIEAFPYTPKDIRKCKKGSFLDEILRTGKLVYNSGTPS